MKIHSMSRMLLVKLQYKLLDLVLDLSIAEVILPCPAQHLSQKDGSSISIFLSAGMKSRTLANSRQGSCK